MTLGSLGFTLILPHLLLATPSHPAYGPPRNYQKNPHVTYEVKQTHQGGLRVHFEFMDHLEQRQVFEHTYDHQNTLEMISRFGLPPGFFRSFYPNEFQNRLKILDNSMFKLEGDTVQPDLSAVTTFYSEFCKPIADFIVQSLQKRKLDDRDNRIAMAMAFTQDIPYGVLEDDEEHLREELSPAPLILLTGFGDCDSKTTLFVGILRYLIDPTDIVFLHQNNPPHLLSAISDKKAPGRWTMSYKGRTFVIAETAGPGRFAFGETEETNGQYTGSGLTIEPYVVRTLPFHEDADYSTYRKASPPRVSSTDEQQHHHESQEERVQLADETGEDIASAEDDDDDETDVRTEVEELVVVEQRTAASGEEAAGGSIEVHYADGAWRVHDPGTNTLLIIKPTFRTSRS